jgi:DNA-binding CsgD family transcriptional regulator
VALSGGELFERERELTLLSEALDGAVRGTGCVVLVEGPAGIGKSRLLAEAIASADGIAVLAARGLEMEQAVPFGLANEVFAGALAGRDARERERLLSGQARLAGSLFDSPATAPGDSHTLVRGLYWLTVNLTLAAEGDEAPAGRSTATPVALVLDDVHWSDRGSLAFIAYLAARVHELPVALFVAARSGEEGDAAPLLDWLRDLPSCSVLRPGRLSEEAVGQVVALDLPGPEPAFVHACAEVSGGNPFLTRELVRALHADRVSPTAGAVDEVKRLVPESVLRSVLVRLARLSEAAQRLAYASAVLADGSLLRHAAALAELDRDLAAGAADELAAAHVLEPGEPLRFVHPLIATAVHSDHPAFARAGAHRRAALLLAADGAPAENVAAHLLLSTPEGDALTVDVLCQAAERALASGDAGAAVRLLERALTEPPELARRGDVLLDLSLAAIQNGDPRADRHVIEALSLESHPAERTRSLILLGRIRFQQGDHAESARLVQEALDGIAPTDPRAQELIVDEVTAGTFRTQLRGRADARMAPIVDAARAGVMPENAGLLAHLALRLATAGEEPRRVRIAAERAARSDPLVSPASHGMLMGIAVQALVCADELDVAERIADDALAAAAERGSLLAYSTASFHRALPRYHRGALDDALADLDQALTAIEEGWTGAECWIGALQMHAHLERGDLPAARSALAFAGGARSEAMDHAIFLAARARMALMDRDPRAALADARAAGEHLSAGFGIDAPGLLPWRETAALAAKALDDAGLARALAGEALERAIAAGVPRAVGTALRTAAGVAERSESSELLGRAIEVLERSPSKLALAHALVDHGAGLRRAGQRAQAQPYLRRGLELADRMGAHPLLARAREELLATGARPRRIAYSGAAALTPTERRVAELAAEGLTNSQIAQSLFVTPKTIQTHLTHAYRKLDIASRHELAVALAGP